jgi:hypothetical protein
LPRCGGAFLSWSAGERGRPQRSFLGGRNFGSNSRYAVTQTTTRAMISTGIQSVIFPSVCLSLEQTVKGRVTGHNASYSRILKLGPVPQARSLEVINITNGNAQIAASPFSRSRWNVLAIAVFFFWRWPTAGGRNGLVPVRPGGKPGKSPNRKKAPPKRGATSRRNLGLIDAMRLLKSRSV